MLSGGRAIAATCGLAVLLASPAAAQRSGDSAARLARADAAYAAGDREGAEREYSALLALDSTQSRAVFRLAQLRGVRDRAAALALYRRYVTLQPRDAWGHIALADALGAGGDVAAARAAYDRAASIAPGERDVAVGRARMLARAARTDEAIATYETWLAASARDAEGWRELAALRRRAGRYGAAVDALERARRLDPGSATQIDREIRRARAMGRGALEPLVGGSRDSDGLATARVGATATSASFGRTKFTASGSAARAGDGMSARGAQQAAAGMQSRPLAQLRFDLAAGIARADRSRVDTTVVTAPAPGRGRPSTIGRTVVVGTSAFETFPVGRARLSWRVPGDAMTFDARVVRQLLDASPYLVAQGVLRDEASLTVDLRVAGPVRVRAFGREGSVHNEVESNRRHVLGGAVAYVPGPYEITARTQTLAYDRPTTLAYFAPRRVRTAEVTTYVERETSGGTTIAIDLGAGGQQVTDWTTAAGTWSPAYRGWAQMLMPVNASFSIGLEVEAYSARVGTDTPSLTLPVSSWRYGSGSIWLRLAL